MSSASSTPKTALGAAGGAGVGVGAGAPEGISTCSNQHEFKKKMQEDFGRGGGGSGGDCLFLFLWFECLFHLVVEFLNELLSLSLEAGQLGDSFLQFVKYHFGEISILFQKFNDLAQFRRKEDLNDTQQADCQRTHWMDSCIWTEFERDLESDKEVA